MKKEGRAVAVLVLLVFFIIAVAACGYYMIKLDKKEKEMQAIQEDLNQIKEELKNKNEEIKEEAKQSKEETSKNDAVSIDVDALNKEHCERILKIMGAGSFDGMYLAIMGKEINAYELNKLAQNTTTFYKNNYSYDVINENYSDYEKEWLSFLSKSMYEKLVSFKSVDALNAIISVDGKVAINQGGWSGRRHEFDSQKLISKNNNIYIYDVKYKRVVGSMDSEEYETLNATVTGKVENGNYIIEKFENK